MGISRGNNNNASGIEAENNLKVNLRRIYYNFRYLITFSIISLIIGLSLPASILEASETHFCPPDAWMSSLTWMKENTPDPFGNPDLYYQCPEPPEFGSSYQYPESVYGVLSWWDYTYWITRIAHRLPVVNPSGNESALIVQMAQFLISQDEETADKIIQGFNGRYVIIDNLMAYMDPNTLISKFPSIIYYAGQDDARYFDTYLVPQGKLLIPCLLFYPDYYRSLAVRLYCFNGQVVIPNSIMVITYNEEKVITDIQQFDNYLQAKYYIAEHIANRESGICRIVGPDPLISPVPLTALDHYSLIHKSEDMIITKSGTIIPRVKIFEYTGLPSE